MAVNLEFYRHPLEQKVDGRTAEYRFRFTGTNGEKLAQGEGYFNLADAVHAAALIRGDAGDETEDEWVAEARRALKDGAGVTFVLDAP